MPAWKVLLIGLLTAVCFGLAMSTLLAPMVHQGNDRWVWMGGSLVATVLATGVLSIVLRYASDALDAKPARGRS
ncbi:MAG: hypothetical protein J0I06_11550 [Planctomycetes bacterium]|nr:hypothetical protein [Planctomycetota bacterium]